MKVSSIESLKTNNVQKIKKTSKKDLTSFGVRQNQPDGDTKKSEEAIKTTFLSKVSFKGSTVNLGTEYEHVGTSGGVYRYYLEDNRHASSDRNVRTVLAKTGKIHANSSIQEIHGAIKAKGFEPKLKAYVADPLEGITKEVRDSHDFIVYDNEPKFPSLDQLRRHYTRVENSWRETSDYHQFCRTLYDYFERLKAADIKTLIRLEEEKENLEKEFSISSKYARNYSESQVDNPWGKENEEKAKAEYFHYNNEKKLKKNTDEINYYSARLQHTKEQQELAVELYNILEESGKLFIRRDELIHQLEEILRIKISDPDHMFNYKFHRSLHSINNHPLFLEESEGKIRSLEEELSTVSSWHDLRKKEAEDEPYYSSSHEIIEKELPTLQRRIKILEHDLSLERKVLQELKAVPEKYRIANTALSELMQTLKINFAKVESFYARNLSRIRCC